MRILISADAEGVTGVTNTNELLFGKPHYEFMRQMMTADVNAAVNIAVCRATNTPASQTGAAREAMQS